MKASAVYLRNQQLLPCERTAELFRDLLLRELKFVEGQHRQARAKEMSAFLLFAKARARNTCRLASSTLQEFQRQYHRMLAKGFSRQSSAAGRASSPRA